MEITTSTDGSLATIAVAGKLTVATSSDLEQAVRQLNDTGAITDYDIDLSGLEYISSAGLRVLVSTQKLAASRGGTMRLLKPKDDVMDVFEMTGLAEIITIER